VLKTSNCFPVTFDLNLPQVTILFNEESQLLLGFSGVSESQKVLCSIRMNFVLLKNIGVNVRFYNMSSSQFFKTFQDLRPTYFDFAWVDGSHKKEDCFDDLMSCAKFNIPTICVDDFRSNDGVFRAVFEFYKKSGYTLHSQSYIMDHRGIICFSKPKEEILCQ